MSSVKYNGFQLLAFNDDGVLSPIRSELDGTLVWANVALYRTKRGEAYSISQYWPSISNNNKGLLLIRPAKEMTIVFYFAATGESIFRVFSEPTFSAAGGVVPNVNRNSAFPGTNSSAIITEAPTITDNGVPQFTILSPGAKEKGGSSTGALGAPVIIQGGDTYLIEIENTSGGNAKASLNLGWTEAN